MSPEPVVQAASAVLRKHLLDIVLDGDPEWPVDEFDCCAQELWDAGLLVGSNRVRFGAGGFVSEEP